jgi:DNA ligase-1
MRPMLSSNYKEESVRFPVYVSPKIDGVRCLVLDGKGPVSRTLKPIPNTYIREQLAPLSNLNLDGELVVGIESSDKCFRTTTSGVMSVKGEPLFKYLVFDIVGVGDYTTRLRKLLSLAPINNVEVIKQHLVHTKEEIYDLEKFYLKEGYEGVMLRSTSSPYKFGRSTEKEGFLMKLKRFTDDEAVIIKVVGLQRNLNEPKINTLGYTERSTKKENKVEDELLGALEVENLKGEKFSIGSGFTVEERCKLWANRNSILGLTVKYKYFNLGNKESPRFPIFLGFRED